MATQTKTSWGLTGNQLKILALLTMTADHVGVVLLPGWPVLRAIGRLALPIYAWMIAEGCRYTRSRSRYFWSIALLGLVCQVVMLVATGSWYQGILMVFSLSLGTIYLLDRLKGKAWGRWAFLFVLLGLFALTEVLPPYVPLRNFEIDYGFCGVMLPVAFYLGRDKKQKLLLGLGVLALLSLRQGPIQWFCLLALPLLWLYNGSRGKWHMKALFYIYYPAHLALIYGLALWI